MDMDRIVKDKETTALTGISKSQRARLEQAGKFPRRRLLSPFGRVKGYLLSELQDWISQLPIAVQEREPGVIGKGKPGPGRPRKNAA